MFLWVLISEYFFCALIGRPKNESFILWRHALYGSFTLNFSVANQIRLLWLTRCFFDMSGAMRRLFPPITARFSLISKFTYAKSPHQPLKSRFFIHRDCLKLRIQFFHQGLYEIEILCMSQFLSYHANFFQKYLFSFLQHSE